jgi:two-component system response regulator RegA
MTETPISESLIPSVSLKGHLVLIDDDEVLCTRLGQAMEKRGYEVRTAFSVQDGISAAKSFEPEFAVVDLRLADGSGLEVVEKLREIVPDCRVIMLTAYGNIATAVAAVKAGAVDYLAKPADADTIERALLQTEGETMPEPPEDPMPANRVRWEHILRVYEMCGHNVSETARRLKMHRRTLQRILAKHAPQEQGDQQVG